MVKFVFLERIVGTLKKDGLEGKTGGKEARQESLGWSRPERMLRY